MLSANQVGVCDAPSQSISSVQCSQPIKWSLVVLSSNQVDPCDALSQSSGPMRCSQPIKWTHAMLSSNQVDPCDALSQSSGPMRCSQPIKWTLAVLLANQAELPSNTQLPDECAHRGAPGSGRGHGACPAAWTTSCPTSTSSTSVNPHLQTLSSYKY